MAGPAARPAPSSARPARRPAAARAAAGRAAPRPEPRPAGRPSQGAGRASRAGEFLAALRGLTTRGRSFLAAGATAIACAYLLGQPALLRVGVLLVALPPAAALLLVRTHYRVASGRRLTPARIPAGQQARAHLRVDNVSRVPTGVLLLEDQVPFGVGSRPRFVLDRVEPRGHREVSYPVQGDVRGRFRLGPLRLRLTDPFGLCELTRSFTAYDTLTVVPRVEPLPPIRLAGEWTGYGDARSRAVALAGEDDVVPRGYRDGDDLRRVHWRSTARYGELMVRREEQPLRSCATVLLDARARGHRGRGLGSSFEWAVSAAASIAVHLLERGYAVQLLTDAGLPAGRSAASGRLSASDEAGLLLDTLAVARLSDGNGLERAEEVLRLGGEGLVVAVLGELDEERAASLARLRRHSGAALALLLDTGSWDAADGGTASSGTATGGAAPGPEGAGPKASGAEDAPRRVLTEHGWTVLRVRCGDSLPALWPRADRYAAPPGAAGAGTARAGTARAGTAGAAAAPAGAAGGPAGAAASAAGGPAGIADGSASAPDGSVGAPDGSASAPNGPTGVPDGSASAPNGPTGTPGRPASAPNGPTGTPGRPASAPNGPTGTPHGSAGAPGRPAGAAAAAAAPAAPAPATAPRRSSPASEADLWRRP